MLPDLSHEQDQRRKLFNLPVFLVFGERAPVPTLCARSMGSITVQSNTEVAGGLPQAQLDPCTVRLRASRHVEVHAPLLATIKRPQ